MSSIAASLTTIQQATIRYGFPILVFLGNFGNIFCIIIFTQKHQRCNSCSLYLLTAAIFSVIGITWGFGSPMYASYWPPDPFGRSLFLCRFRGYILQVSSLTYKIMLLLACIDRFALTSPRLIIRRFAQAKIALKIIGGAILICLIISIHLPIFETIKNNQCSIFDTYGIIFSIYQICIFGGILPILRMVFCVFILKNLKMIRTRIRPLPRTNSVSPRTLTRRDTTLIKLTLAEVVISFLLTFWYPINTLYSILASDVPNKSQDRIGIERFLTFVTLNVLAYLNYCITFYLYVSISEPFRKEIKQLILKCVKRSEREPVLTTGTLSTQRRRIDEHI